MGCRLRQIDIFSNIANSATVFIGNVDVIDIVAVNLLVISDIELNEASVAICEASYHLRLL